MQIPGAYPRPTASEGLKGGPSNLSHKWLEKCFHRIIGYTHHKTQGDFLKSYSNQPFKIEKKVPEAEDGLSFRRLEGSDPSVMPSEHIIESPKRIALNFSPSLGIIRGQSLRESLSLYVLCYYNQLLHFCENWNFRAINLNSHSKKVADGTPSLCLTHFA